MNEAVLRRPPLPVYIRTLNVIVGWRHWSSDLRTKQRPLAAGFKVLYYTEHATIAWSDCAIRLHHDHTKQRPLAAGFKAYCPSERTEHATNTIAWIEDCFCSCVEDIFSPSSLYLIFSTPTSPHIHRTASLCQPRQKLKNYSPRIYFEYSTIFWSKHGYTIIIKTAIRSNTTRLSRHPDMSSQHNYASY